MKTNITIVSSGAAGAASRIAVNAFNNAEIITAVKTESGNLKLIGWRVAEKITRAADSKNQAGAVDEIAMTILGRRVVTAVRTASNTLKLISWDVPSLLGSVTRLKDSGTKAGTASFISMTAVTNSILVTAVRTGSGALKLISWRLQADGGFTRLGDSRNQAGAVSLIAMTSLGISTINTIVTAVRTASNTLKLISWNISADGLNIERQGDSRDQAGAVGEIAMVRTRQENESLQPGLITAVQTGSGTLRLIAWRLSPDGTNIERLGDSRDLAGKASRIAIAATGLPSTYLTSMRIPTGDLKLIAFQLDRLGGVTRTGELEKKGERQITETELADLRDDRVVCATRLRNSLSLLTLHITQGQ